MANILKQITLTEKGANAGPLYDVYYSIDCSTFILAVDGTSVYLPIVGATTLVTVPDTTQCIRLVNKTEECNDNFITSGSAEPTTTTTAGPTTTTSTTTAGPTTTTTTDPLATTTTSTTTCTPLYEVQLSLSIFPCFSTFGPCCTTAVTRWLDAATLDTATIIYSNNDCLNPTWNQGITTYVSDGTNCRQVAANTGVLGTNTTCTVTCPTTTTTTTTTTQAPTKYKVELCGGGEGPFVVTISSGELPAGIGQALKLFKTGTTFNGVKCWEVLENPTEDPIDFSNVGNNEVLSNCEACIPTTTTTSTTTTTTLAPSSCYRIVNETETSKNVDYTNPAGEQPIVGVPGASIIYICVKDGTTPVADEGLTVVFCGTVCTSDANCFNCNSTTTTTTAAPTTTTTTLALNFDVDYVCNEPVFGETPTATVTADNFVGASGVYQITQVLYLTQNAALNGTYIDTGGPSVDFFSVENGTWWVAVRDKNNTSNKIAKSVVVNCPEATTTTTTQAGTTTTTTAAGTTTTSTTTTTQAPTKYKVELCGGGEGPFVVTLASGDLPSGIGQAYKLNKALTPFNGVKCWEILENPTTDALDYPDVAFGTVFSNCSECIGTTTTTTSTTTTTTTTTTIAPTTTTTTIPCYSCNDGIVQGSYSGDNQYTYPDRIVCNGSLPEAGIFNWSSFDRPNRFSVYDDSGLKWTSGWVGYADYPGPWTQPLNTPTNGSSYFQWGSTTGRYVRVEAGPADTPPNNLSDAYEWSISCTAVTTSTTTTTTTTSTTTTTTQAPGSCQTVQSVFGYMEPCIGGSLDDHMGATVYTDLPVLVDTNYEVQVSYVYPGNSCQYPYTQILYLTQYAGDTFTTFNACSQGAYFPGGVTICDACINTCDNADVIVSNANACGGVGFGCSNPE